MQVHTFINWEMFISIETYICTGIKNWDLNKPVYMANWSDKKYAFVNLGELFIISVSCPCYEVIKRLPKPLFSFPANRPLSISCWMSSMDLIVLRGQQLLPRLEGEPMTVSHPSRTVHLSSIHVAFGAEDLKLEDQRDEPACLDPGSMVSNVGPKSNLSPALSLASE